MYRTLFRILRWTYRTLAALITLLLIMVNARFYTAPSAAFQSPHVGPGAVEQLAFIRDALDHGAGDDMQALFPEGFFFTHVLYGLAWTEIARRDEADSVLKARAVREARWAFGQVDSPKGREPFSSATDPPYGVFCIGWRARLMGGLLFAQPPAERDPDDVAVFQRDCAALAGALQRSPTPFLCAYPDQAWPCDTVVAVAALAMHDRVFEPRYADLISSWSAAAGSFTDPANQHLVHRIDPRTHAVLQPRRGTSQVIINRFLPEFAPLWAANSYFAFKQSFADTVLGVPALREYPRGASGAGDVDSGPLIFGCSASATIVAIGAANMHGDEVFANSISQSAEGLGLPITFAGRKRSAFGVMPVGDAFLVWSRLSAPLDASSPPLVTFAAPPTYWRLNLHILTLAIIAFVWLPAFVACFWDRRRRTALGG